MGIGILLITLTIINIFLLILGIVLIFTYFYYYSIAIFFVNIMLYLVISIIFFKHTNKQLEKDVFKDKLYDLQVIIRKFVKWGMILWVNNDANLLTKLHKVCFYAHVGAMSMR